VSRSSSAAAPHSWSIADWPPSVYPNDSKRGRYLVREHKTDLLASGALSRVGRELVVLGPRYCRWLERQSSRVPDFECAANAARVDQVATCPPCAPSCVPESEERPGAVRGGDSPKSSGSTHDRRQP